MATSERKVSMDSRKHPIKRHSCPFPIECVPCEHKTNITDGLFLFTPDSCSLEPVALDCEMVGVGPNKLSALGRVTIVGYSGQILYDMIVRPDEEITDYRTRWSGIVESDMHRAIPFLCAQDQVQRIIQDRVVVGHMVHYDFHVLHIKHPTHLIRDTGKSPYAKLLAGFPTKPCIGLKALTLRLFGIRIQTAEHCSVEDARATMAIYRLVQTPWENDLISVGRHKSSKNTPIFHLADSCTTGSAPDENAPHNFDSVAIGKPSSNGQSELCILGKRKSSSSPNVVGLNKSSSSLSLLDDDVWQDCNEFL